MNNKNILVTGAAGQLGSELTPRLVEIYGKDRVILSDINSTEYAEPYHTFKLDVTHFEDLSKIITSYKIDIIYHLAAILSARAEKNFKMAWKVNIDGLLNVLEAARLNQVSQVFWPSSIAVFGPDTPKLDAGQKTIMNPTTVYGISKLTGEQWCAYYNIHFDMDIRSLRYPGLIGYRSLPGGGTTDYAVEIFHAALKGESYNCYISSDTYLPMMLMEDAIRATTELMQAEKSHLSVRHAYNIAGVSFTPLELARAIQKQFPNFKIDFTPDYRDEIAHSWPDSIDDSLAIEDWEWQPRYDLKGIVDTMITNINRSIPSGVNPRS